MSSIAEKKLNAPAEKVRFLRAASFQKLCLAAYPLQLAGSICTRDSLKQLIETVLCTAKSWMQKVFVVMSMSVFNFWRATMAWLLRVLTAIIGVDEAVFIEYVRYERLLAEQRQQGAVKSYSVELKLKNDRLVVPSDDDVAAISAVDSVAGRLMAPLEKPAKAFEFQKVVLRFCVYGSAGLVYVQLMSLLVVVNNSQMPAGLMFLITTLGLVGYIIAKISFMKKPVRGATTKPTKRPAANQPKDCNAKLTPGGGRKSRTLTRPSIYLTLAEQRLSKIKLL